MASKMRAANVIPGDLLITPWDGCSFRVTAITPSPSGKVVQIGTVVESSSDPGLAVGRAMNFGRRAGTSVLIHRVSVEG
jgi:hypothetical protein